MINRIEGKEDELLERITQRGRQQPGRCLHHGRCRAPGPGRCARPFRAVKSRALDDAHPRQPAFSRDWFAFSTRARVIIYNKAAVNPADVQNYEDLAGPNLKGKVCVRSGAHPYNLSLGSALIHHLGEQKTEEWAKGLVANFARAPKGGDTDQIRAVAAGECGVSISNTYYIARLLRSEKPEDKKAMEKIGVVWPNQKDLRHAHQHLRRRHAEDRPAQGRGD